MLVKILKVISGLVGVYVTLISKQFFNPRTEELVHYHQSHLALNDLRQDLCKDKTHTMEEINVLKVFDEIPGYCPHKESFIFIKLLDALLNPCSIREEDEKNFELIARRSLPKLEPVDGNQLQHLTFQYRKLVESSRTPSVLHNDNDYQKCKKTNLSNKYTYFYNQSTIDHRRELEATESIGNITAGVRGLMFGVVAGVLSYQMAATNEESINNAEKNIKKAADTIVKSAKEKLRAKVRGFQDKRRKHI